jgi:RHS repeat-associated protein
MKYNQAGQEIEKLLPGSITNEWQYDRAGRPGEHRISQKGVVQSWKKYTWDANDRLTNIFDAIAQGNNHFKHDTLGNLVFAQYADNGIVHRAMDATGNLYETTAKSDRTYNSAGALLESSTYIFKYDEEGNLLSKTAKGTFKKTKYEWCASGRLQKVIRPDGKAVTFTYDALGRRISKTFEGIITRWVWDGNRPLHEWSYPEKEKPQPVVNEWGEISYNKEEPNAANAVADVNGITWVFEPDSYRLAAKIVNGATYSVINDHLGTPQWMYDATGKKVWEGVLDIYGRIRSLYGSGSDMPFRYQGQYEDVETGLCYNLFRFYDPEQGNYISQDPIGLAGSNPTLYGYVKDPNVLIDPFGLNANPETAQAFEERIAKMPPGERVIAVNGKVAKVARKNGWEKDSKISRLNGRDVYKDADGSLYAADTQHGRIEYNDKRGRHLGEYDIDGVKHKPADASGGHNLRCG